jgi:ribosomal protein S18 acetylase RimI-like enzyme
MKLEIRHYQPSDQDFVWALHRLALEDTGIDVTHGSWDEDLYRIEAAYLESGGEFLVGTLDRHIVAMGALRRTAADRAEIKRMRVHPDFQRRGFGQAILDTLEARAQELGYETLHLDTSTQQTAAQQFYVKNGYVETGREERGRFTLIFYEKRP